MAVNIRRRLRAWFVATWTWIGVHKDQLTLLLAIIAGVTALIEYRLKVHADRRAQTVAFVESYRDEHWESRSTLLSVLYDPDKYKEYIAADTAATKHKNV